MSHYLVTWEIDTDADSPLSAAKEAYKLAQDPGSTANVYTVIEENGDQHLVDLELTESENMAQLVATPATAKDHDSLKAVNAELLNTLNVLKVLVSGFYATADTDPVGPSLEGQKKEALHVIQQALAKGTPP